MMRYKGSLGQKILIVGAVGGALEWGLELLGQPLSENQKLCLLFSGIGATAVWLLDDILGTLEDILKELKRR